MKVVLDQWEQTSGDSENTPGNKIYADQDQPRTIGKRVQVSRWGGGGGRVPGQI